MHRRDLLTLLLLPGLPGVAHASGRQSREAAGTVRGRVVDDRGRPLAACRVEIGTLIVSATDASMLALPLALRTDENGVFDAKEVPAGDWHIRVEQDALAAGALAADVPDYPITYYPGVTDPRRAGTIHVDPGEGPTEVEVVVTGIPVFEMVLRVAPLDVLLSTRLELFLDASQAGRPRAITPRAAEPGGIVRFGRLRAGPYFVWARAHVGDRTLAAWRRVEIADRSVAIDFRLVPTGRLSGRVTAADPHVLSGTRVVAVLVDGQREVDYRELDSSPIDAEGGFAIDGVFAHRQLRVLGLPDGWNTESVRVNGQPTITPIAVAEGANIEGIEIVVARR